MSSSTQNSSNIFLNYPKNYLDTNLIIGSAIISGLFIGLLIDKIKTLANILPGQKKPEQERVAFKRKNSLRKYTQRKNSAGPIGINNKKRVT